MAHLLTPPPATAATALSARPKKISSLYSWKNGYFATPRVCCVGNQHQHQHNDLAPSTSDDHTLRRRALMGLSGAVVFGLSWSDEQSASGAGRPPPRPPKEKQDPNVSGVVAKVMASKKRKEAMKEEIARLREKGKAININKDPSPAPAPAPVPTPASE
ncbi:uncharacterized protein [Cicer arietinum]|uniref:Uncharacterized protein LOC101506653 n=1 Tax=Cicer arietinum TaxID=3827 RepID=A0A1S2YI59_CICAR|nr:uncharacterized protein LOC101506653 [Cicer arietinum]